MDKFTTLEPVRLYNSATSTGARLISRHSVLKSAPTPQGLLVGRLPADLHLLILTHLPIPDLPSYSRCSRATAALSRDEKAWETRWKSIGVERHGLASVLDDFEAKSRGQAAASRAAAPPTIPVEYIDDDFGDFASANILAPPPDEMGDFVGAFSAASLTSRVPVVAAISDATFRSKYVRAHTLLKPAALALSSPPHLILSALWPSASASLRQQAKTLHLLSLFLSPWVQPVRAWETMYSSLRAAMDRFDANLLAAFDLADSKGDEPGMREAAESSWEVWDGRGDWEMGKVWAEKREIFYEQGRWEPMDNFTSVCPALVNTLKLNTSVGNNKGWTSMPWTHSSRTSYLRL